jgi:hypothetical protein
LGGGAAGILQQRLIARFSAIPKLPVTPMQLLHGFFVYDHSAAPPANEETHESNCLEYANQQRWCKHRGRSVAKKMLKTGMMPERHLAPIYALESSWGTVRLTYIHGDGGREKRRILMQG